MGPRLHSRVPPRAAPPSGFRPETKITFARDEGQRGGELIRLSAISSDGEKEGLPCLRGLTPTCVRPEMGLQMRRLPVDLRAAGLHAAVRLELRVGHGRRRQRHRRLGQRRRVREGNHSLHERESSNDISVREHAHALARRARIRVNRAPAWSLEQSTRARLLLPPASGSAGGSAAQQRIAVHGDAVAPR